MSDHPEITPEPAWERFLTDQCARTPIDGVVLSVLPFGAFVRLHNGVDALLHMSEWAREPSVGETIPLRVIALDLTRRRVSVTAA